MISEEGFCTGCRHWVVEHPHLLCPWCEDAKITALGVDVDDDPGTALVALRLRRQAIMRELNGLAAVRRELCRRALADLPRAVETSGYSIHQIERWAERLPVIACPKGHPRIEFGKQSKSGIWRCVKCVAEQPKRQKDPTVPARRKEYQRLRAAWVSHQERMERRAELLAEDPTAFPDRLREEMPPPS